jgi:uncharacterized damage-inducible protein DinB
MMTFMDASLRLLLDLVDEAFDRKSWHGTTLFGSLRGLTAAQATKRPGRGRHNIWELVVHAAYWKYAVRRRLTGERRGSFAYKGSNWFERPVSAARRERAFAADIRLLVEEHRKLREAIVNFPARQLSKRNAGKPNNAAWLIRGIAAHDLYHAGQVQLLKKVVK